MSKKSLVAIDPQASLTIGNPEIVNMLVQQQVRALEKEKKELLQSCKAQTEILTIGSKEILMSQFDDFNEAFGKKLDAYAKARGALSGRKLLWVNPFGHKEGEVHFTTYPLISKNDRYHPYEEWNEKELEYLRKAVQCEVIIADIPTAAELKEWCGSWQDEYDNKEDAYIDWSADNSEGTNFFLSFFRSEKTIDLIKKYREIYNQELPNRRRLAELDRLLGDTTNIEKAILAKMTENTLRNSPQLVEAFEVLTERILGLPYAVTPQLTIDVE